MNGKQRQQVLIRYLIDAPTLAATASWQVVWRWKSDWRMTPDLTELLSQRGWAL